MIRQTQIENKPEKHIINEMQLIMSGKRTALALLRTGIAVLLLPLSALTVLLATSRYYDISQALQIAIPVGVLCVGMFILGLYLIIKSSMQIKKFDHVAHMLLQNSKYLSELMNFKN